jgi:beta-phosphoglucomutase-like phosphatase (HAD superfamily)
MMAEVDEGEDIMVNAPYDVFILPLQPSGLSRGPRFVVHVPGPEQPAAEVEALRAERDALKAENARLREALDELLEALQAIVDEVSDGLIPYSSDSYLPAHLVEQARAALAKGGKEVGND